MRREGLERAKENEELKKELSNIRWESNLTYTGGKNALQIGSFRQKLEGSDPSSLKEESISRTSSEDQSDKVCN